MKGVFFCASNIINAKSPNEKLPKPSTKACQTHQQKHAKTINKNLLKPSMSVIIKQNSDVWESIYENLL